MSEEKSKSKVLKKWKHKGKECVIVGISFNSEKYELHHYCGYVKSNIDLGYDGLQELTDYAINVHGGLTFHGKLESLSLKGEWYGFDCAHSGDATKGAKTDGLFSVERLWDEDKVIKETERLAIQMKILDGINLQDKLKEIEAFENKITEQIKKKLTTKPS